ncbi:MAG: ABC transporter ATP-binding protein [Ignisphaera sp.]
MVRIIEVRCLVKVYPPNINALRGITFDLASNGLFVVCGPNGAGKTTLLRILYTALLPTSGDARVLGYDVVKEAAKLRRYIAAVPQDAVPEPYLTPREFVELYLIARGFSRSDAVKEARRALEILGQDHVKDRICLSLSGGERKRVLVAAALATNAEIMFLDEPTAGLDPLGRASVHEALRSIVKAGHTVVMTTHLLNEAEDIADLVIMINRGALAAIGRPEEVKMNILMYNYRITIRNLRKQLVDELKDMGIELRIDDNKAVVYINKASLNDVLALLARYEVEFSVDRVGLDDAFRELVKQGAHFG